MPRPIFDVTEILMMDYCARLLSERQNKQEGLIVEVGPLGPRLDAGRGGLGCVSYRASGKPGDGLTFKFPEGTPIPVWMEHWSPLPIEIPPELAPGGSGA